MGRATEDDLLHAPQDGQKYELVDGELRVSPAGYRHGRICVKLSHRLEGFAEESGVGFVLESSTGFRLPNGNVRLPDVAFVAKGRLEGGAEPEGFTPFPPDLAVEVLSPSDTAQYVLDKVGDYLDAGVRLIWVIDPEKRRATIYRAPTDVRSIDENGVLDGEDVVPGFRCVLASIL